MVESETVTAETYRGGNICTRCGHQGEPLEPLFDIALAAQLVPMHPDALRMHLSRNKAAYPPRYRLDGSAHRRKRLLSASEIQQIRRKVLRGPGVL